MKKIIALMLALILCFAMLVSCGGDEEGSSSSQESSSQASDGPTLDLGDLGDMPNDPNYEGDNVVEFN